MEQKDEEYQDDDGRDYSPAVADNERDKAGMLGGLLGMFSNKWILLGAVVVMALLASMYVFSISGTGDIGDGSSQTTDQSVSSATSVHVGDDNRITTGAINTQGDVTLSHPK